MVTNVTGVTGAWASTHCRNTGNKRNRKNRVWPSKGRRDVIHIWDNDIIANTAAEVPRTNASFPGISDKTQVAISGSGAAGLATRRYGIPIRRGAARYASDLVALLRRISHAATST